MSALLLVPSFLPSLAAFFPHKRPQHFGYLPGSVLSCVSFSLLFVAICFKVYARGVARL